MKRTIASQIRLRAQLQLIADHVGRGDIEGANTGVRDLIEWIDALVAV